ncbi:MAG: hypothetical protein JWR15_3641 [Prosthecobacter sp.]|nr:hypothetical protein [Prosthecobacter sp.]
MKQFILFASVVLLSSCESTHPEYHAGSAAEARAYVKRAIETGVTYKGAEAVLVAEKSAGKPAEGKWNPQKIESFVKKYAADHPRLVEVNLAATRGQVSEKDRAFYTTVIQNQEEREAEFKKAQLQDAAAGLSQNAAMMNQNSSYRANSALMQSTPQSSYSGYGSGFGGTAY